MLETLSAPQARRVFLHAQGLARKRPPGKVGEAHFRAYLERQRVLQLDSVNVLVRAHYMPVFSRFGGYDREALDRYLWSSGEVFEHWGHEASTMPISLLPLMRYRMESGDDRWGRPIRDRQKRVGERLIERVEEAVHAHGPLSTADLAHLDPEPMRRRGSWWDLSDTKLALEYLFLTGRAAVAARPNFRRRYAAPANVWGAHESLAAVPRALAQQQLFDDAIGAVGIGTLDDLADHFRIYKAPLKRLARSAVERGLARWVSVEGWTAPTLMAEGAADPGRATGAALLSPFDPVAWYRERLLRMFGMHYRIEIYTPAPKRVYGYYTLPFLLGDQLVARVDLKADRKASALLARATWLEEKPAPGARRRAAGEVAAALALELGRMADWLALDDVAAEPVGTLAHPLRAALAGAERS